jgi:stalled ribosome alternative rescue factor ArfA
MSFRGKIERGKRRKGSSHRKKEENRYKSKIEH